MKQAFAFLLLSSAVAFASPEPSNPTAIDPTRQVTITLPVQDWKAVLDSVSDSAGITARDASRINQTIISQLQAQLGKAPKK